MNSLIDSIETFSEKHRQSKPVATEKAKIYQEIRKIILKAVNHAEKHDDGMLYGIVSHKVLYRFKLERVHPNNSGESAPELVSYLLKNAKDSQVVDFPPAVDFLTEKYLKKILSFDPGTINTFTNKDTAQLINYIKKGLGYLLMSEGSFFKNAIQNIIADSDIVTANDGKEYLKSDHQHATDFYSLSEINFGMEGLIDLNQLMEDQKNAFFWVPGQPFKKILLAGEKSDRAVYLAYFYSFLRKNSYATLTKIAREMKASITGPSRDWIPHHELERPFRVDMEIMFPVYFSPYSLEQIGLMERKTRCYRGAYDDSDTLGYGKIKKIKVLLWNIYLISCEPDFIQDRLNLSSETSCRFKKDDFVLVLRLMSNQDRGVYSEKGAYRFIHIESADLT